jgi:glycosyltransferase involved in cell wall biosynthesis
MTEASPLRILVVSNLFPPRVLGGYEILAGQVAEVLERAGHAVTVLASPDAPERTRPLALADVRPELRLFTPFPRRVHGRARLARWRAGVHNRRVTLRVIDQVRPDAALVFSQQRLGLGAALALRERGVPTLFTLNDEHLLGFLPAPFGWAPRRLLAWAFDRFVRPGDTLPAIDLAAATAISRVTRDRLVDGGAPVQRAAILFQGIPVERFPCKPEPGALGSPLRVLYAGQLHPDKGVHTLIEAVGRVQAALPVELEVAGDGPAGYVERLKDQARGCPAAVRFLGQLPHGDLPALYRAAHVFVFPSEWAEPFGLTHLEAMASGTPVISTTEGGHGEFLRHRDNCLAYPGGDAARLAESLEALARDPEMARHLALRARREVEERFTIQAYAAGLVDLLRAARAGTAGSVAAHRA